MRGFQFIYKIELYNNIRTAFLIDIDIVPSYNFRKAILYIKKNECNHFDIIMFVGNLFCNSFPLLKIPTKYEPKKFNFTGKFIDKSFVDDDYFKLENWNVNLSCYDLL